MPFDRVCPSSHWFAPLSQRLLDSGRERSWYFEERDQTRTPKYEVEAVACRSSRQGAAGSSRVRRWTLEDVGVVIVTFNSADHIVATLSVLPLQSLHQVVVVDNASRDRTVELIESSGLSNVRLIRCKTNGGFGAGCNTGVRELAQAKVLLFLNPDARISPTSLQALLDCLQTTPGAAVVVPRMRNSGVPITSASRMATLRSELRHVLPPALQWTCPERRLPASLSRTSSVDCPEGACMLVDADAFRRSGAFDEGYFLFFEEHDLARRLAKDHLRVVLCAEAWADHSVGASREELDLGGREHYVRSSVRYLAIWRGPLAAMTYRVVAWASWSTRRRFGRLDSATADALLAALRPDRN